MKWLCDYIVTQCSRPPQAHSRDLHSSIVAAFQVNNERKNLKIRKISDLVKLEVEVEVYNNYFLRLHTSFNQLNPKFILWI